MTIEDAEKRVIVIRRLERGRFFGTSKPLYNTAVVLFEESFSVVRVLDIGTTVAALLPRRKSAPMFGGKSVKDE